MNSDVITRATKSQ